MIFVVIIFRMMVEVRGKATMYIITVSRNNHIGIKSAAPAFSELPALPLLTCRCNLWKKLFES